MIIGFLLSLIAAGFKLFVGNLPFSCTWRELKDHMKDCDGFVRADVAMNDQSRSKGYGLVEFSTRAQALAAIDAKHDSELGGKPSVYSLVRLDVIVM
jgi:RNA recognition motif-containing protein